MRAVSVFVICLSFLHGKCQFNPFNAPLDTSTGRITFTDVREAKDQNKDQIFNKVKLWISEFYKSPKDVINMEDRQTGIILLKPIYKVPLSKGEVSYSDDYSFSFSILVKDNKYKLILTDINFSITFEKNPLNLPPSSPTPIEDAVLIDIKDPKNRDYIDTRRLMFEQIASHFDVLKKSIAEYVSKAAKTDF